jgi:hypothetical protein
VSVREGEILFTLTQNPVYIALNKKFLLRSPFDRFVRGEEVVLDMEPDFEASGYNATCNLAEIIDMVDFYIHGQSLPANKVRDAAFALACAYRPFLIWEDDVMKGLKRIGNE